jgi:Bacterial Ig domain/Bacterial cadherin-like domain
MTSWRRSAGLLRVSPTSRSVKLCLECLETRIVPTAGSALLYVYNFQGLATKDRPDQIFFFGEQFARYTINNAAPNAEGDQEVETDLRILQSVAGATPLVQEAEVLSIEALGNPATAGAGVSGLYLTVDAACFLAGMDNVASTDLPQVFANATATANGDAFLAQALLDFQIASVGIGANLGVMPHALTIDEALQLQQQPDTVNAPPTAANDSYNVDFNTPLTQGAPAVLSNDTDPRGEPISVANPVTFTGANGQLFLAADGSFTYTPNQGATGTETFTYQAQDSRGVSNVATITFNITNPPPVAVDHLYNVASNTTLTSPPAANILAGDSDPDGEPISVANPGTYTSANGKLVLAADGSFTYTPNAAATGTDSFNYQAQDAHGISNAATITFNITANPPPTAVGHTYTTDFGITLNVAAPGVLTGSSDPHGEKLTVANPTPPGGIALAHGTLVLNADGSFTYTPTQGATGTDTFNYQAKNTDGVLSNQVTLTITITPPPTAANHTYSVTFGTALSSPPATNVLTGASDPDGDTMLAVANPTPPAGAMLAHGSLVLNANGSFTYTPVTSGTDTFAYLVKDSNGVLSNRAILTFNVSSPPPPFDADLDGDNSSSSDGQLDNDGV